MKVSVAVLLFMLAGTLSITGQESQQRRPNIDGLLVELRSKDSGKRYDAFKQLKSDSAALQNLKVKAALLDLLDYESERTSDGPRPGNSMYDFGEEGFAEYISELSETVSSLVDWDDQQQACRMVNDGVGPLASTSEEAARREKLVWPCLKQKAASKRMLDRARANEMIIQLSARAGSALDPTIAQEKRQIVIRALHDQDESVRAQTVKSLEKFGAEDVIPTLKQIAESDPAIDKINHNFWIREYAVEAIAAIQKRAGQH